MSFEQFVTERLSEAIKVVTEFGPKLEAVRLRVEKLERLAKEKPGETMTNMDDGIEIERLTVSLRAATRNVDRLEAELLNERENVALLNAMVKPLQNAVAALKTMKGMPTDLPSTDATCSPPPMTCYCAKCVHDRRSARMDDRG